MSRLKINRLVVGEKLTDVPNLRVFLNIPVGYCRMFGLYRLGKMCILFIPHPKNSCTARKKVSASLAVHTSLRNFLAPGLLVA